MKQLHFINGHRYDAQGATGLEEVSGHKLKVTEWAYAQSLHDRLKTPFRYYDAYSLNKYVEEEDLATAVALEFHLNSFNSPTIEGYEVLILENDTESLEYAKIFTYNMFKVFPLRRNRGIKLINPDDRGYNNLLRMKQYFKIAILTEAFFLNNPEDWINREDMAKVINNFNKQISDNA